MTQQTSSSASVLSGGGSVIDFTPHEVKILVVEENRTTLTETQEMLVSLKYQVKSTTSREEAQKAIKAASQSAKSCGNTEGLDVMLVEDRLAYGSKAAARLLTCAEQHGVRVVITVAKDDKASVLRAFDAGAVQALPRPLRRYQLAKLWHHAYRRRLRVATSSNSAITTSANNKRSSAAMSSSSNSIAIIGSGKEHKDENVETKDKAVSTTSMSGGAATASTAATASATPPPNKKPACGSQVRGCHSFASGLSTLSDREMLLVNEELRKLMPNPEDISKSLANSRAENLLLDHGTVATSSLTSGSAPGTAPVYDIPMMGDSSSISMDAEISLMEADMASSLIRCDDVSDAQNINNNNNAATGMSPSSSLASLMSSQAQSSTSAALCEFPPTTACEAAPQPGAVWGVPVSSAHIPAAAAGQVTTATAGHPAPHHVNLFGFGGSFFTPAQDPWGAPVSLSVAAQCQALAAAKKTRSDDASLSSDMTARAGTNERMVSASIAPPQMNSSSSSTPILNFEASAQPALGLKLKKSPSLLSFISQSLQATQSCS